MSGKRSGPRGPLPGRWLKCPRKGELIADKFVPFKTPLDENFKELICDAGPQYLFTPAMLINSVQSTVNPKNGQKFKLGLWIDLTNTTRFYDKVKEVESKNIKYVKLQCKGREETPTQDQTNAFIAICKRFIHDNPDQVVGVHCTHGFNRTGFLISSYLVEEESWDIQAALATFQASRPPGIYKDDYIKELFNRYDEVDLAPPAPERPDWCFEEEDDDDVPNSSRGDGDINNEQSHGSRNAAFMNGVPGVNLVNAQDRKRLITVIRQMTGWTGRDPFPGAQPVSMTVQNISFLREKPYKVSWKADGTRYMMLILNKDEIYFFDRNTEFFKVDGIKFPKRKSPNDDTRDTLLDGEMVMDKDERGRECPRYLVYDIVKFEGDDVGGCNFDVRMTCLKKEIIGPRDEAKKAGKIDRNSEPFGIRVKDFWDIVGAKKILSPEFTKNVSHETDGLIFQPVPDPYTGGTCQYILKWKPHTLNSIDFRLKLITRNDPGCLPEKKAQFLVQDGPRMQIFFEIKLTKSNVELKQYDNQLVECTWDDKIKCFKVLRTRTDKPNPNSLTTAQKVMESILNPVTENNLLNFIDSTIKKRPHNDAQAMPAPVKKPKVANNVESQVY